MEGREKFGFDRREGREGFGEEENRVAATLEAESYGCGFDVFFCLDIQYSQILVLRIEAPYTFTISSSFFPWQVNARRL